MPQQNWHLGKKAWFIFGIALVVLGFIAPHLMKLSQETCRLVGFLGALAGLFSFFVSCGFAITGSPFGILRTGQNTYSIARLQMAAWTWVILSSLIGVAVARLWQQSASTALDIYIPANLLTVMGISFFTGAAAPALMTLKANTPATDGQVQTARDRTNDSNLVANGQLVIRPSDKAPHFSDLVQGDDVATFGTVDISKVQQLLITALLIGVYFAMLWDLFLSANGVMSIAKDLRESLADQRSLLCGFSDAGAAKIHNCGMTWAALPDFPASLVTLLAVSHGGYLAYKAVPKTAADNTGGKPTQAPAAAVRDPGTPAG